MDIQQAIDDLLALPVPDRLWVVGQLWDSIDREEPIAITAEQQAELDRRLDAHEANPNELLTWDEVLARLRGKL